MRLDNEPIDIALSFAIGALLAAIPTVWILLLFAAVLP